VTDTDRHPRDDPERLRELYHDVGLTMAQIGERVGMTSGGVLYWMKEHGIDRETHAGAAAHRPSDSSYDHAYRDPDYLRVAYWEREQSLSEIAAVFAVSPSTVKNWMTEHNIPRREASGNGAPVYSKCSMRGDS